MNKNLKLSYILIFAFSAILIAFKTLSSFFSGVAINFIGLIGLTFVVLLICLKDKETNKRIKDLFIICCAFILFEFVIYFACEFGSGETIKGFSVYQNIISFLGLLFLAYIGFRFTTEYLNKKIKFIEIILGNQKKGQPQKKAKELTNGCLEDKPNNKPQESKPAEEDNETEVVIETEE